MDNTYCENRITNLAKYYSERGHLIRELQAAIKNIKDSRSLEESKEIASRALDLIQTMSDKTYPKLDPNGEFHTGHLHPEYLELPRKQVFTSQLTNDDVSALPWRGKSLGIK
jgi:hypothetical protein